MKRIVATLLFCASFSYYGFSQFFTSPANPVTLKWKQIENEHFQVLFPTGFEEEANKVANYLTVVYEHATKNLNYLPKKTTIILQNQGVESNGFVVWAPKRSEFYTTPEQNFDTNDWLAVLSLHEFRHVVQISKLNQGITKVATLLMGEQGLFITNALVPTWFLEGDAVYTETVLTQGGRGRRQNFGMPFRTQLIEQGAFKYEKASFGSYKHIVDNHYILGYHLVSYVNTKFGSEAWSNTLNYVARHPFVPFAFSNGLKKQTGYHTKQIYRQMINEVDSLWQQQLANTKLIESEIINNRTDLIPTSYKFPYKQSDTSFVAIKTGFNTIPTLIKIDAYKNEHKLHEFGNYGIDQFSVQNNKAVWVESMPDLRWGQIGFSDIKLFDIETNIENRITFKSKLFSPSLNKSASKIIATSGTANNVFNLVVFNTKGTLLDSVTNPENYFYSFPTWVNDSIVAVIIQQNNKKGLALVNLITSEHNIIIPFGNENLANPYYSDNHVYFEGEYAGVQNIFAVNIKSNNIYQVSSVKFGAFNPSISNNGTELLFENYTSNGYDACKMVLDTTKWIPFNVIENNRINYFELGEKAVKQTSIFDSLPLKKHSITDYNKSEHLFNIHSWSPSTNSSEPYLSSLEDNTARLGFTLFSQSNLSDLVSVFSYEHYSSDAGSLQKRNAYNLSLNYSALFPIFSVKASYYNDLYKLNSKTLAADLYKITPSITLPFNFTTNKYSRNLRFVAQQAMAYIKTENTTGWQTPTKYSFSANRLLKRSKNQLLPKWGQSIQLGATHNPANGNGKYNTVYGFSSFYLPGFTTNAGFYVLAGGIYYGNSNKAYNPLESSKVSEPRGLQTNNDQANWFYKVEYRTPILYPDLNISFLTYIKRVKATLFYDYTSYQNPNTQANSFGIELIGDMNVLRFSPEFDFGIRISKGSVNTSVYYEPIMRFLF